MIRHLIIWACVFLVACESPKAPTFFTSLTIPFSKDRFDIFDLQDEIEGSRDSIRLLILNDSVLIDISRAVDPVTVADNLSADPTTDSTEGVVRNDLEFSEEVSQSVSLGRLAPVEIRNLHGQNVPVPPFGFSNASTTLGFDSLQTAGAVSGTIVATITNGIPVTFDTLQYYLVDLVGPDTIANFLFLNLAPLQTMTRSYTIPYDPEFPVDVTSPVHVFLSGHSTGSNGTPVPVDTSDAIDMTMVFDLTCRNITGIVPAQTLVRTDSVKSTSNSVIEEAVINTGRITYTIRNTNFPVGATINYTSLDFLDPQGDFLTGTITIPIQSGGTITDSILLNGYTLRPFHAATMGNQYFYFSYTLTSEASSTPVTIENNQGVMVTTTLDTIKFDRITGRLAEETIDIDPRSESINIEDIDSVTLEAAYLEIIAEHNIQFPIALDLNVIGRRTATQQERTAHIAGTFERYTGPAGGSRRDTIRTTAIQADTIAQLFSLLPDSIIASGSAIIGDNSGAFSGTVTRNDSIKVTLSLRAPLIFSLPNDTTRNVIQPKPREMDLGESVQDLLANSVESILMSGEIENHFPVGVEVQFFIDTIARPDSTFYDSAVFVYPQTPLLIGKATTDPVTGLVTAPTTKTLDLPVDQSEYEWLFTTSATKYRGLRIRLLGTGGTVKVSSTDHVRVDTDFQVELKIDEDFNP